MGVAVEEVDGVGVGVGAVEDMVAIGVIMQPSGPVYCQQYMENVCFLRSCDASSTDEEAGSENEDERKADASGGSKSSRSKIHRCAFLHDPDFRRLFLARTHFRSTHTNIANKASASTRGSRPTHGDRRQRHGPPANDVPSMLTPHADGRIEGLKAPTTESLLLKKLLGPEMRIESSRILQAIRFIVSRQCLLPQREAKERKQREALEEYERLKKLEKEQEEEEEGERQTEEQKASPPATEAAMTGTG